MKGNYLTSIYLYLSRDHNSGTVEVNSDDDNVVFQVKSVSCQDQALLHTRLLLKQLSVV